VFSGFKKKISGLAISGPEKKISDAHLCLGPLPEFIFIFLSANQQNYCHLLLGTITRIPIYFLSAKPTELLPFISWDHHQNSYLFFKCKTNRTIARYYLGPSPKFLFIFLNAKPTEPLPVITLGNHQNSNSFLNAKPTELLPVITWDHHQNFREVPKKSSYLALTFERC
jgi:hypothetical protein